MIKSIIIKVAVVLIAMLIIPLGRGLFFYEGSYSAPPGGMPNFEYVVVPAAPSTEFFDTYEEGKGTILIDLAHDNAFNIEELNVLISRLVARGLTIDFFSPGDDLKKELLVEEAEEGAEAEEAEEGAEAEEAEKEGEPEEEPQVADAYIIVSPQEEFSKEERETVEEFVNNGGKLLLIDDPTRYSQMNSLSLRFGLIFEADYLYNQVENEINYRNIFITDFKENELTEKLEKIVFYTAGSISSTDDGMLFVDENTFSSLIETRERLSPIAQTNESKVLAIYDLTFITEPYNGIHDNNQLISNIADWLASPAEEEKEVEGEASEKG